MSNGRDLGNIARNLSEQAFAKLCDDRSIVATALPDGWREGTDDEHERLSNEFGPGDYLIVDERGTAWSIGVDVTLSLRGNVDEAAS